jgi:tetratricopeptide (TPR) repeat protein
MAYYGGMNPISVKVPGNRLQIHGLRLLIWCLPIFLLLPSLVTAAEKPENSKRMLPRVKLSPQILELFKAEKWPEAIEALSEVYDSPGSDNNLRYYLAYCYERQAAAAFKKRKYRDALQYLEQASHYLDDEPELYLEMGICSYSLSQYADAEVYFKEALRLNPLYFPAHKKLGEIYYLRGDNEQALYHWEEALKQNPGDKALAKRLQKLKKFLQLNRNFETEIDTVFLVSFDGKQDLKLSGKVMSMMEDIYRKIGQELNLYPNRQIQVVLLTNREFFDITGSPAWAGGVYEGHIKVPVENVNMDLLKVVLCHEYIHAVIYDRLPQRCPWWLNEGLAQYFSGDEAGNRHKLDIAAALLSQGNVPPLRALPGNWLGNKEQVQMAYALALSAVRFFMEKFTRFDMQSVLEVMAEGKSLDAALPEITAFSFKEFESEWKQTR